MLKEKYQDSQDTPCTQPNEVHISERKKIQFLLSASFPEVSEKGWVLLTACHFILNAQVKKYLA